MAETLPLKTPSAEPEKQSAVTTVATQLRTDFLGYLQEYISLPCFDSKTDVTTNTEITDLIDGYDIVVFGKVGCGFCKRAKEALFLYQERTHPEVNIKVFDVYGVEGMSNALSKSYKKAVAKKVGLYDMTFPQIVVGGVYVGGADDLLTLMDQGKFPELLKTPHVPTPPHKKLSWETGLAAIAAKPQMLNVPILRGSDGAWYPHWPWYSFHWVMYANLVRYISVLQIGWMFAITGLLNSGSDSNKKLAFIFGWIFLFDLIMFTALGPSPWSPSGAISTYFGWKTRGNVTSALPYKVVFLAYIAALVAILPGGALAVDADTKLVKALAGAILNSVFLAVFRF